MIDEKKFSRELYEDFLEKHPKLKSDDSVLAEFVQIVADVCAAAVVKYDRDSSR